MHQLEPVYRAGIQKAEVEFGAECRDFDRVLGGIAEVLATRDIHLDPLGVSRYWHNPLAGTKADEPLEKVASYMEGVLSMRTEGSRKDYHTSGVFDLHDKGLLWRSMRLEPGLDFDEEVKRLIENEIKRKFTKVRRNTKRHKELFESVLENARKIVTEDWARVRAERLASFKRDFTEVKDDMEHATRCAAGLREMADHVAILLPESHWVADARTRAEEIEESAAKVKKRWQEVIEPAA